MTHSLTTDIAPSSKDWAKLAAYIDGEGCISITKGRTCSGRQKRPQHSLNIVVANVDTRLMQWLIDRFGGTVNMQQRHSNGRRVYSWKVSTAQAAVVLENTMSEMVCKYDQAQVALELQATMSKGRKFGVVPEEIYQRRDELREKLRTLKHQEFPEFKVQ